MRNQKPHKAGNQYTEEKTLLFYGDISKPLDRLESISNALSSHLLIPAKLAGGKPGMSSIIKLS